jgi:hypothetical protein
MSKRKDTEAEIIRLSDYRGVEALEAGWTAEGVARMSSEREADSPVYWKQRNASRKWNV